MSGHIANTGLYSIVSIATGIGFIGLGKIGQFLKSNGSVVSAGLLTALATAAAVPLTKKGIVYLPPEVYQNKLLQNYPRHKADPILKALGSGALSFIITTLLINKLTYFISSYHLSLPKKIGVGLLSGGLSFLGFSLIMSKIEIEKQKQKASHQSVEQLHLSITETAHLQNLDERDRLFKQLESSHQKLACLTNGYSLESPPAQTRIETFNESIGTSDAAVYAMFFDQIEDQELQKALLAVFDQTPFYDQRGERITREAIEASMRKSSMVDTSLTKEDGIAAGISGALTLAATSAIITIMILTSRLAHWTWNSYPTLRGVFPAALMTGIGYGIEKTAINDERVTYLAAFVLGTFASPIISKLISTHQMSYWHGAGFSTVGILSHWMINEEN